MDNATAWIHNLDPFIFQFSGGFGIRWYGMAYLAGFVLGYLTIFRLGQKGPYRISQQQASDFVTYLFFGVLLGGRLGYCLFYSPDLLFDFSASFPFWGALAFWEGGMASHGGFAGVVVACYLYSRKSQISMFHLGDLTIVGASLGIFFGRIANFINGELFGRQVEGAVRWAVKFPQEMYLWLDASQLTTWRDVYQEKLLGLKAAASKIGVGEGQWVEWVNTYLTSPNSRSGIRQAIDNWIELIQSGREDVRMVVGEVLTPRHPSQLYAAVSEGLLPFLIILFAWKKPQKPGVIAALYLSIYPFSRIFNEMFRMPDAHLGFQWLGLTRGQWLSIVMAVGSLAFLVYCLKRPTDKVGGWGQT